MERLFWLKITASEDGQSLVEQIIAIAIVSFAVLLPSSQITGAERAFRRAETRSQAELLARNVMEDLLLQYSANPDLEEGVVHSRWYNRSFHLVPNVDFFQADWEIVRHSPIRGIAEIKLELKWTDSHGPGVLKFWTARLVRR